MEIMGREYKMLYTVGAQQELAELCPDNDLKRLREALSGKAHDVNQEAAKIPIILSEWHERAESLIAQAEGREYAAAPLEWETVQFLTPQQFGELMTEAFTTMARDSGRSVEADGQNTQKKTEAAAGS